MKGSIVAPRDTLDMPRLRDGGRREIPWENRPDLDPERRALLVHAWRWRAEQEHLAVGAFAQMATLLAKTGADSIVLSLVTRAAADEVRHLDVCKRLAEVHHGGPLDVPRRGVPAAFPGASDDEAALFGMIEMCCLSETCTGVYFTEMLEETTHPLARAVVQSLLEDEIDHGRVGWAYLATAVRRAGVRETIAARLPELAGATLGPVFDEAREAPEEDDPLLLPHGWLGRTRGAAIYRRAFEDVIVPGFRALGVATEPVEEHAKREGWTP